MSRRGEPSAAAQNAAKNQAVIKGLLKREPNKICADCKRNKHPRWASWNLGVFVCIRCSGIHRGMGTHISRVKSVDLDAWTDEQLASIVRWGNQRANIYWESKLAPGHVPSDSKIENFIRTKYESKRWVMDGPMPDPSTLDPDGDDDVPLNIVQERAKAERNQRVSSTSNQPLAAPPKAAPQVDLFGDVPEPPARPSTTDTPSTRQAPPQKAAPPKQQKAADSLLGLDFFGGPQSLPQARPGSSSSTPAVSAGPSRPDLKQSILSLYATAPKPQAPQHDRQSSFGTTQSPPTTSGGGFGGLDDAFGNLNFGGSPTSQQTSPPAKADPFASMTSFSKPAAQKSSPAPPQVTSPLSGGGFFSTGPKQSSIPSLASKPPQKPQANLAPALSDDFGSFNFASTTPAPASKPSAPSGSADLFDFASPSAPAPVSQPKPPAPTSIPAPKDLGDFSAFHLSKPTPQQQPPPKAAPTSTTISNFSDSDAWGSNDAWSTPNPPATSQPKAPTAAPPAPSKPSIPMSSDFSAWGGSAPASADAGWGGSNSSSTAAHAPAPKVAQDEDFGDWGSAVPATPVAAGAAPAPRPEQSKPAGGGGGFGGGGDDLFSNVWG